MARSPLFGALTRSLRQAAADASRNAGSVRDDLSRLPSRSRAPGNPFTRREFVLTTGGALVGLGLVGCRPGGLQGGSDDPEVVIVGAGIAGLTAGWRLRQAGVPVRILEAQDRVGGRMFSIRDHFPNGQVAELGGELIDTGHETIQRLAAELGLELNDLHESEEMEPEVWWFGGRRITHDDMVGAWGPVARRIRDDLAGLPLPDGWPWVTWDAPAGAESLDRLSLAEWLAGVEMDPWFREILDVGFTSQYGLEADRQSALNLHTLIDPDPDDFLIYGESDERFHIRGGNDQIPRRLARELEDAIEMGVLLESVREGSDGRFELSVRSGNTSRTVRAHHLVLALPFTLLRDVELAVELPEVKRRAIQELGYGTNAKLMMGFTSRPWRSDHTAAGTVVSDLPFQVTWETSRLQPGPSGILTNFTGGRAGEAVGEGSTREQAVRIVSELETVFPGVSAAHDPELAVRFHWPTHPWTRGSYACYLPGQWTGIAGAEGMPVGRLHFAGEHTSLDAQGYMEGGAESGERVATEILGALGMVGSPARSAAWPGAQTMGSHAQTMASRPGRGAMVG